MLSNIVSVGGVCNAIAKKVREMDVPQSIEFRVACEHIHAYQLVEKLLPICAQHGLALHLSDGEGDRYDIKTPFDIIPVMHQCDMEWLCVTDENVDDPTQTFFRIVFIYGNNAHYFEDGRGEMIGDWGGCVDWYEILDPVLSAFIENREVEEVAE